MLSSLCMSIVNRIDICTLPLYHIFWWILSNEYPRNLSSKHQAWWWRWRMLSVCTSNPTGMSKKPRTLFSAILWARSSSALEVSSYNYDTRQWFGWFSDRDSSVITSSNHVSFKGFRRLVMWRKSEGVLITTSDSSRLDSSFLSVFFFLSNLPVYAV